MKRTLKDSVIVCLCAWGVLSAAPAATDLLPQLHINSTGPAAVVLSWPASAGDFVLEESLQPSALGWWEPVPSEPALAGQTYTVQLSSAERARFYRLHYQPSILRSTTPAISTAGIRSAGPHLILTPTDILGWVSSP